MPKSPKNSGSNPRFNPAELRAVMEQMLGGLGSNKHRAEERAQDLVYDAMEASTWAR
jgi:hypothetical protein